MNKQTTFAVVTDAAMLNKRIDSAIKATAKLTEDIQTILVSAAFHAVMHGNIDPINRFFNGVGKGVRRAALQGWLDTNAPVMIDKESGFVFSRDKLETLVGHRTPTEEQTMAYVQGVATELWTDYKPEQMAVKSLDVVALVQALLKKAAQAQKAGATIEHGELIEKLSAMVGAVDSTGVDVTDEQPEEAPM